jgi:lysophospholipase L1-like esterase
MATSGQVVSPLSDECRTTTAVASAGGDRVLPATAVAVEKAKKLKVLAIGASSARRPGGQKGFIHAIEAMLEKSFSGLDVQIVNRGVSGELAADAAKRLKIETAMHRPDLVIWQVGTHDALAFVPVADVVATVTETARWLRENKIDLVLVGLRYAHGITRDTHYQELRKSLRSLAASERVLIVSRYDAAEAIEKSKSPGIGESALYPLDERGADCAAEYVARAISVNLFVKRSPAPQP